MPSVNPFKKAVPVARKLKILISAPAKSGKTTAAMTFPRPAFIDTERGTDLYIDENTDMAIFRTLDLAQIESALAFIKQDNGKSFDTVVIDSITPIYQLLLESEMKRIEKFNKKDNPYTNANLRIRYIYNDLIDLPVHVVVTARETVQYKSNGAYFEATGTKPDSSRDVEYPFDFIISMDKDHRGQVVGQRGNVKLPAVLPKVEWAVFQPIADAYARGEVVDVEDERDVVDRDVDRQQAKGKVMPKTADPDDMTDTGNARAFVDRQQDSGISQAQLKDILGVKFFTEFKSVSEAEELVNLWWRTQNVTSPTS